MYNHEPENYNCVFCHIIKTAAATEGKNDIVFISDKVMAFLSLGRWPKNPLDVLIVPTEHIENIYDLPLHYAAPLHEVTRAISLALKHVYQCDGISTRQHNEPAGDQDVWHYHVHVTPRFAEDNFYKSDKIKFDEEERLAEARKLREYIHSHQQDLFGEKEK